MTLVLTISGRDSIWALVDRRLSARGRPPKEDGRKIAFLEGTDGLAILAYAGLGATARGTEPADWMTAVLRGRKLEVEQSLSVLAAAVKQKMPRHLVRIIGYGTPAHNILIPSFVAGQNRLYSIDTIVHSGKEIGFRYTRHVMTISSGAQPTPRFGVAGSGAQHLIRDRVWRRQILRMISANERGRLSAHAVADRLAELNYAVHLAAHDGTVGPRSIVAWRYRKGGRFHNGGGGHHFYTGIERDRASPGLPTVANGMDIHAITTVMMPYMTKMMEAMMAGDKEAKLDDAALNAELALLPDKPDEGLR